jgi:hypothetical protein
MAIWDQGGGCPCGLYRECECGKYDANNKEIRKLEFTQENAFGFSLVSEEEVKRKEHELKEHLEKYTTEVTTTIDGMTTKLNGLRDLFMPILVELSKNPERDYIFWPGIERVKSIGGFIERINKYISD